MAEAAKARPASTILLLRDSAGPGGNGADDQGRGEIEVFMMVRHYEIDFNSGALVFPGGAVDPGDHDIAGKPELYAGGEGLDAQALGFRIAAIRETFEESGILLAKPRGRRRWSTRNGRARSKHLIALRFARAKQRCWRFSPTTGCC